ncbi:MAG: hypothetical protein WBZ15_16955, partial [Mycobacterium sp.]
TGWSTAWQDVLFYSQKGIRQLADLGPGATDFWVGRDEVASALGGASRKSPEPVSEEFASNTLTGRFSRSD